MSDAIKSILLNKEVIAVDQDPLGKQATPVKNGNLETWIKPLKDGGVAVGVVNLDNAPVTATVKASELPLKGSVSGARDLWAHTQVKFVKGNTRRRWLRTALLCCGFAEGGWGPAPRRHECANQKAGKRAMVVSGSSAPGKPLRGALS